MLISLEVGKGIYRIYAAIKHLDTFNPGVLRASLVQYEKLSLIELPMPTYNEIRYWDIGLISVSETDAIQFIPINYLTHQPVKQDLYLKDYQALLKFIDNSKSLDLKTLLGTKN